MALTDVPTIKPSKGALFIVAVLLGAFLFFGTETKPADAGAYR
ncbi:hypothetical protein [Siminovitchia fortis]|nr:hypothetical protein [Siminovitchia fortis]WHY81799.1 hypothetical protein QNH23_18345 [Siminovitchia fortis]